MAEFSLTEEMSSTNINAAVDLNAVSGAVQLYDSAFASVSIKSLTTATDLEVANEVPENAAHTNEGEDQSVETSTEVQPVVHVPRGRGRPKGSRGKRQGPVDVSPLATRAARRRKLGGSENGVNGSFDAGSSGYLMKPVVSNVQRKAISKYSAKKRSVKIYPQADSIICREKRTGLDSAQFSTRANKRLRGNTINWTQNNFSADSRSNRFGTSSRRMSRADEISSPVYFRPRQGFPQIQTAGEEASVLAHVPKSTFPSTSSERVNGLTRAIESRTSYDRSVVPRCRPEGAGCNGRMEIFRGRSDEGPELSDFDRELFFRFEDHEKEKLVLVQEMHSSMMHEMKRSNGLLEFLLKDENRA